VSAEEVAVFGGSFNPPHVGHVLAVSYVRSCWGIRRVVVVPVFEHAFDKDLAEFSVRAELTRLAFEWLPEVEVSAVEETLPRPSFTLQTLTRLAADHPGWALRLVVGSDVLHERDKWRAFDRIETLAPLIVIGRAGHPHPDAPPAVLPEVSSTRVRELLRSDSSEANAELSALVPLRVRERIRERGLYR
jgi:nicotinate-nucleotide adenylyltransferase